MHKIIICGIFALTIGMNASHAQDVILPAPGSVVDKFDKADTELVIVSAQRWKAIMVALDDFKKRPNCSEEQRNPKNYLLWINTADGLIEISFIPVTSSGEVVLDINPKKLQGYTYLIEPKTYKIIKTFPNK